MFDAQQQTNSNRAESLVQRKGISLTDNRAQKPVQLKANNTGLPDNLKSGIENLSGHSMDDVKVHYNSAAPAQLNAHAYAQGNQIHVAPGQEKHVPHEAWHVVQQKQGRVRPTMQMKGKVNVNDDSSLEKEADVMGEKALQAKSAGDQTEHTQNDVVQTKIIQRFSYDARNNHRVSDNGHYRVDLTTPTNLLIHPGEKGPKPGGFFHITGTQPVQNARGAATMYQKYQAKANLSAPNWAYGPAIPAAMGFQRLAATTYAAYNGPNDCGMYATGVVRNNANWGRVTCPQNAALAAGPWVNGLPQFDSYGTLNAPGGARNKKVKPQVRQALVIEPPQGSIRGTTSKHANRSNFHAAPVVIATGSDYITNEADAGDAGRAKPYWRMSGTKKAGQSWHEQFEDDFKDSTRKRRRQGLDPRQVWPSTHVRE